MRRVTQVALTAILLLTYFLPIQSANAILPAFDPETSRGIYFDGQSSTYVQCALNPAFDLGSDDFTIDWWQKKSETQTAFWPRIFQFGQGDLNADGIAASEEEDGKLYFWLDGRNPGNRGAPKVTTDLSVTPSAWVHIALTRYTDRVTLTTNLTIYINGVSQSTTQIGYDPNQNLNAPTIDLNLYIGGANHVGVGGNGTFTGEITAFQITKRVLWTNTFTPPTDYNAVVADRVLLVYPTNDFTSSGLTNPNLV
jgi:hypothetical protein